MIKKEIKTIEETYKDFLFLQKSTDFARGTFKIYEHINGLSKICYLESFLKKPDLQKITSIKFQNLQKVPDTIIQPLNHKIKKIKTPSEILYKIKEYYNYYPLSLSQELKNKKKYYSNFNSEEITHLFYNMMDSNSYLQENGLYHGLLNPEFIFINQNKFFLQMANIFFEISEKYYYKEIKEKERKYFSPEIYEKILYPDKKMEIDFWKNDVFSLALVIIECGTGFDINKLYSNYGFDTNILKFYFEEFKNKFKQNKLVISAVKAMLELNYKKRPSFVKLKKVLPPYEKICGFFNVQTKKNSPKVCRNKKKRICDNLSNASNETPSFANYKNSNNSQNSSNISEFYLKENNKVFGNFNITDKFVVKKKLDFENEKKKIKKKYFLRDKEKDENNNNFINKDINQNYFVSRERNEIDKNNFINKEKNQNHFFINKQKFLEKLALNKKIFKEDGQKTKKKKKFKYSLNIIKKKSKEKNKKKDKSLLSKNNSKKQFVYNFKQNLNFISKERKRNKNTNIENDINFFNKRRNNLCEKKNEKLILNTERHITKDENIFDKKFSTKLIKKNHSQNIRRISLNSRKNIQTLKKSKNQSYYKK